MSAPLPMPLPSSSAFASSPSAFASSPSFLDPEARPHGATRRPPRATVTLCVEDPDLAEDCLAAAYACGLAVSRQEFSDVQEGTGLVLYDAGAYERAGDDAYRAARAAYVAIPVRSDLVPFDAAPFPSLHLPSESRLLIRVLESKAGTDTGARHIVVLGAHGGAGTSTLACLLALRAAEETETVLVESELHGPGLDLLLGIEDEEGLRMGDIGVGPGALDGRQVWTALPRRGGLAVAAASRGGEPPQHGDPHAHPSAVAVAHAALVSGKHVVTDGGAALDASTALLGTADLVVLVARSTVACIVQTLRAVPMLVRHSASIDIRIRTERGDGLVPEDYEGLLAQAARDVGPETSASISSYPSRAAVRKALDSGAPLRAGKPTVSTVDSVWRRADVGHAE